MEAGSSRGTSPKENRGPRGSGPKTKEALCLRIRDLTVNIHSDRGSFTAVDGISLDVPTGHIVGLVGESGCGKTLTSLSVMRLHDSSAISVAGGKILFSNTDLRKLTEEQMRFLRGNEIAMIFQDSLAALNPVQTLGSALVEALQAHERKKRKREAIDEACALLEKVGFQNPQAKIRSYPHELSGGMRQRAMIAMALAGKPRLLIADEPTTALDVTVQKQILELLKTLQRENKLSILFVTHDLALLSEFADEVVVMYAGKVVENAPAKQLFQSPRHPYTQGLLKSLRFGKGTKKLATIRGTVPDLRKLSRGCRFAERCPEAFAQCTKQEPPMEKISKNHNSACWLSTPDRARGR